MRRRSSSSSTPLTAKQKELAQREAQLREQMRELQQMIEEAPRKAEETTRRQRAEMLARASADGSRLDVSMTLRDKRFAESGAGRGRRVPLRKERHEGRIIFLVLVIALAAAVLWLASHLRF